jgi:hypothetical protein
MTYLCDALIAGIAGWRRDDANRDVVFLRRTQVRGYGRESKTVVADKWR